MTSKHITLRSKAARPASVWTRLLPTLPSILLILTAGWFASCSSDDDEMFDLPQTAITFGGGISAAEAQTRAGEQPLHLLRTQFRLMGYKHMDNAMTDAAQRQTVFLRDVFLYDDMKTGTTTDNTMGWYYVHGTQEIRYWDFGAVAYRFFAVAGEGTSDNVIESGVVVAHELTFPINGMNEDDRSIAPADKETPLVTQQWMKRMTEILPGDTYKQPVTLTFYKPMARVRFILLDENGTPLTHNSIVAKSITPSTIQFKPTSGAHIYYGGTGEMINPLRGYTPGGEHINVTHNPTMIYTALTTPFESQADPAEYAFVTAADDSWWYHVIENTTQGSYTLSFDYNGVERSATVPAQYMQWQTGYSYTYAFKVSATAVNFDMKLSTFIKWQAGYTSVTDW